MDIIFTNMAGVPEEYSPKPASKFIPDWYKNLESYISGKKAPVGNGTADFTAKRCMPIFDAIVSGYIIVSPADVYVSQRDGQAYFEWSSFELIAFHPKEQAIEHPYAKQSDLIPKWNNYWSIKTPKGYSTMFIPPVHRESVFSILPGVVDTDTYTAPVNFPFTLNDPKFEGLIPAGTPIAQVIPFKRESWEMKFGGEKELIEQQQVTIKLMTKFFDRYKSMFRQPKEYK